MPSNLVLKTVAKVSHIFVTTKFSGKFFSEKFFSGGPKRVPLRAYPFSLPCSMQGKILRCSASGKTSGLHSVIRISFLQCVSLSKAVAKVQTFSKPASVLQHFFITFLSRHPQKTVFQKDKTDNQMQQCKNCKKIIPYIIEISITKADRQKRTDVLIHLSVRFKQNTSISYPKQTDVFSPIYKPSPPRNEFQTSTNEIKSVLSHEIFGHPVFFHYVCFSLIKTN